MTRDDELDPVDELHLDPVEVAVWEARFADLRAYRARVASLAADITLPRVADVWCAACGHPGRRAPAVVVDSPDGRLLVTRVPMMLRARGQWLGPAQQKQAGRGRPDLLALGWLVDGPNTYAARFGWRPPGADDMPTVRCATHGTLTPDLDQLRAAILAGAGAVGVGVDGVITRMYYRRTE